MAAEVNFF